MTGPLDPQALSEIPIFRSLTTGELNRLTSVLRSKTFPADTNIINADQPGETVYVIRSGTVKVHADQPDGSNVILAILGPGEVIGEIGAFDRVGRSASVVTMEPCSLCWMDFAAFSEAVQVMPQLALNLLSVMARRLRLADAHIQALASLDVYGRVAHQLLTLAGEYGEKGSNGDILIPVRLTQGDLADFIGATRVRVNQVLNDYKDQGLLSIDGNYHFIINRWDALAQRVR